MKTFTRSGIMLALLALALPTFAQNRTIFAGQRNAITYAYGTAASNAPALVVGTGPVAAGTGVSITLAFGFTTLSDGTVITPLATSAPITIGIGANAETVTPSAVSCATPTVYNTCTITATTSNAHGTGDPITSGSYGLQEAVNAASTDGGGIVITNSAWISAGATKTLITNMTAATPKVWVYDVSGLGPTWYGKSGTTTAAYSSTNNDMSFQLTESSGTATKTLSQTYATAPSCVGVYVSGTITGILKVAPTTTTVVATDSVSETNVVQIICQIQK